MNKIAIIGSLNMDLVMQTNRIPEMGETIAGEDFHMIPGGKGANQAVASAKLGAQSFMIGKLGQDSFAKALLHSLENAGVCTKGIMYDDKENTGTALILVSKGDNMIVLNKGSNGNLTPADIEKQDEIIRFCDYILMQLEIPLETVEYVIDQYHHTKKICLDPAPLQKLKDETLRHVDFITPNEWEAAQLCGLDSCTTSNAFEALDILKKKGIKYPIITLGSEGCAYYNGKKNCLVPAYQVNAIDTTAAGDTFTAAFLATYKDEASIDIAIDFAQKSAAITTMTLGAQPSIPYKNQVEGTTWNDFKKIQL